MPQTPHVETHFTASEFVRDVVIGMADGLTVPFALAAGLSGADITTRAGAIIDNDGLAADFGQFLSQKARHHVVRSARGKGNDNMNGSVGEYFRRGRGE